MPKYHFDCGDSNDGHIGFCAVIEAGTDVDACAILRAALPEEQAIPCPDYPEVEYINVYFNADAINVADIDDADIEEEEDKSVRLVLTTRNGYLHLDRADPDCALSSWVGQLVGGLPYLPISDGCRVELIGNPHIHLDPPHKVADAFYRVVSIGSAGHGKAWIAEDAPDSVKFQRPLMHLRPVTETKKQPGGDGNDVIVGVALLSEEAS